MPLRRINSGVDPTWAPTTASFAQNMALRQRNAASAVNAYNAADETFGDPMHAQKLNAASQNLTNARTDVSGIGAVLQGLKEAIGDKRGRVGMQEQDLSAPSAHSPASWNPAGQTQSAAMADVQGFVKGGALPDGVARGTPSTQEAFRRRVLQGIRGVRG